MGMVLPGDGLGDAGVQWNLACEHEPKAEIQKDCRDEPCPGRRGQHERGRFVLRLTRHLTHRQQVAAERDGEPRHAAQ